MDTEEDDEPEILCPCTNYVNRFWFPREEVFNHLIANRFNKRYKVWNFHGGGLTTGFSSRGNGHQCDNQNTLDNMDEMLNDIFRDVIGDEFSSKLNRAPRNNDDDDTASNEDGSLFPNVGRPLGVKKKNKGKKVSLDEDTLTKTHRYVLFNCDEISDYISEHQDLVNRQRSQGRRGKRSRWVRAQDHSHDIGAWFKDRVREENVSKEIKALS
uniref:Transposase-associated domain-containing protein n=1 Tax=Chenopodium quinoa TaxID=63459 RepID=A0A803MXA6_CHEQI